MKTTRSDKLIIIVLFILAMFSYKAMSHFNVQGSEAHVFVDGKTVYKIDLGKKDAYAIEVKNGRVVIEVTDGKLYITSADCPRKICVDDSPISMAGESLICIPNNMIVKITGKGEAQLDTVTR